MNNIKNKILILTLGLLFLGCSKSATSIFNKDPIYGQNIQYSKIIKVLDKDIVKAILNITYLNSVDSKKWDKNNKQNFLIGVYSLDDNNSKYQLTMNNMKYLKSMPIKKEDQLSKNIAFENHWATYNLVSFPNTKSNIIKLTYTYDNNQTVSTSFLKE